MFRFPVYSTAPYSYFTRHQGEVFSHGWFLRSRATTLLALLRTLRDAIYKADTVPLERYHYNSHVYMGNTTARVSNMTESAKPYISTMVFALKFVLCCRDSLVHVEMLMKWASIEWRPHPGQIVLLCATLITWEAHFVITSILLCHQCTLFNIFWGEHRQRTPHVAIPCMFWSNGATSKYALVQKGSNPFLPFINWNLQFSPAVPISLSLLMYLTVCVR